MTRPPPWAVAAAALAVPVSVAHGQPTTAPNVLNEPIRYGTTAAPSALRPAVSPTDSATDLWHVVAALLLVVALIFILRWAARKLSLVPDVGRGTGRGVRLLSRTVLAPKQQVMLLQIGRRVVVVGDSGGAGMRALAEITDPDEVAAIIGEVRSTSDPATPAKTFASLFGRAKEPYDAKPPPPIKPAPDADLPGDVAGLLNKVRGIRQQFDR